jgi:hypothetical protein
MSNHGLGQGNSPDKFANSSQIAEDSLNRAVFSAKQRQVKRGRRRDHCRDLTHPKPVRTGRAYFTLTVIVADDSIFGSDPSVPRTSKT